MIAARGLTRRYDGGGGCEAIDLDVAEGELLAVVGPSGAGKSTLLRLLCGLEPADAGTVAVAGADVTAAPPAARGLSLVFQQGALFPHLDVAENIGFGLRARGVARAEREQRVRDVAARLEIDGLLGRRPAQLSGGERRRVGLARGLAGRPRALLLDEPLAGLDEPLRDRARAELRLLQRTEGITMVVVTHDQAEALSLGDRVAVLGEGRLLQHDTPAAVYERPASIAVATFIGRPPMTILTPAQAAALGLEGTVGVRAEHVVEDRDGAPAEVELVERAGHEVLAHLRLGGDLLPARLDAAEGTTVRVRAARHHRFAA